MIFRNLDQIKRDYAERLIDEINPASEEERKELEDSYYKEVGRIMETATIDRYVPLFAYKNIRARQGLDGNGNGNGKNLGSRLGE